MGGGKQRGGGNNPSCGCDMQAGWPSASQLPRGGLQGGGNWNFNEFNLALSKNGKTKHLRGKWNKNNNGNRQTMNNDNNGNKRNTMRNNTNNNNNNNANRNTTNKRNTMKNNNALPPSNLDKLMYEGKLYETDRRTGKTYENGTYVGTYVRPNSGKPYLNREVNENSAYEYDTEEMNNGNGKAPKTLMMNGGKRGKGTRKHGKRCSCLLCTFKQLKWAGGRR
jgi:hypothetical protein